MTEEAPDSEDSDSELHDSGNDKSIPQKLRTAEEVELVLDDAGEERFRSSKWEKPRPSAIPIDSPPTRDFTTAAGETRRIQLPDVVELTVVKEGHDVSKSTSSSLTTEVDLPNLGVMRVRASQADDLTTSQRVEFAIDLLRVASKFDAKSVILMNDFADSVDELQETDSSPANLAATYVTDHPDHLRHHVDDLCTLLQVPDQAVSRHSAWCLMELAEYDPLAVVEAVPTLVAALDRDDLKLRQYITYTFSIISQEYPEELLPALNALIDQFDHDNKTIQTNSLSTVGRVVGEYPDKALEAVDSIASFLPSDEKRVQNNAIGLLADIAQQYPEIVIGYADKLASRLDDENIQARINASIALLRAGEANPDAIRRQQKSLEQALDDASPEVRANVCALIANAEVPVDLDHLRDLRQSDPNDTVREHANWACEKLQ